jgi:cell division cycle protein 37
MKLVCRQSQILSHIHELGRSMKRDPRDVILPFFKRIQEAEYLQGFLSAVEDFISKIKKRAIEKRKEMDAEKEQENMEYFDEENVPLGPGGLNPLKVLKELPASMRDAFESQDTQRLQDVLGRMDPVEAKYWMKQCVDSGLWVAKDPTIFEEASTTNAATTGKVEEEDTA